MRKISEEELKEIISRHQDWLNSVEGGERADLRGSDLRDSDLRDSDLRYSDLRGSNLSDSDLRGSDLRGSDLRDSDLRDSDLSYSDLRGSNLSGINGNRREIKSLLVSEIYPIAYTSEYLQIGCERHAISDWWKFDDSEIFNMDGIKAAKFWKKYKLFIKRAIKIAPATPTK